MIFKKYYNNIMKFQKNSILLTIILSGLSIFFQIFILILIFSNNLFITKMGVMDSNGDLYKENLQVPISPRISNTFINFDIHDDTLSVEYKSKFVNKNGFYWNQRGVKLFIYEETDGIDSLSTEDDTLIYQSKSIWPDEERYSGGSSAALWYDIYHFQVNSSAFRNELVDDPTTFDDPNTFSDDVVLYFPEDADTSGFSNLNPGEVCIENPDPLLDESIFNNQIYSEEIKDEWLVPGKTYYFRFYNTGLRLNDNDRWGPVKKFTIEDETNLNVLDAPDDFSNFVTNENFDIFNNGLAKFNYNFIENSTWFNNDLSWLKSISISGVDDDSYSKIVGDVKTFTNENFELSYDDIFSGSNAGDSGTYIMPEQIKMSNLYTSYGYPGNESDYVNLNSISSIVDEPGQEFNVVSSDRWKYKLVTISSINDLQVEFEKVSEYVNTEISGNEFNEIYQERKVNVVVEYDGNGDGVFDSTKTFYDNFIYTLKIPRIISAYFDSITLVEDNVKNFDSLFELNFTFEIKITKQFYDYLLTFDDFDYSKFICLYMFEYSSDQFDEITSKTKVKYVIKNIEYDEETSILTVSAKLEDLVDENWQNYYFQFQWYSDQERTAIENEGFEISNLEATDYDFTMSTSVDYTPLVDDGESNNRSPFVFNSIIDPRSNDGSLNSTYGINATLNYNINSSLATEHGYYDEPIVEYDIDNFDVWDQNENLITKTVNSNGNYYDGPNDFVDQNNYQNIDDWDWAFRGPKVLWGDGNIRQYVYGTNYLNFTLEGLEYGKEYNLSVQSSTNNQFSVLSDYEHSTSLDKSFTFYRPNEVIDDDFEIKQVGDNIEISFKIHSDDNEYKKLTANDFLIKIVNINDNNDFYEIEPDEIKINSRNGDTQTILVSIPAYKLTSNLKYRVEVEFLNNDSNLNVEWNETLDNPNTFISNPFEIDNEYIPEISNVDFKSKIYSSKKGELIIDIQNDTGLSYDIDWENASLFLNGEEKEIKFVTEYEYSYYQMRVFYDVENLKSFKKYDQATIQIDWLERYEIPNGIKTAFNLYVLLGLILIILIFIIIVLILIFLIIRRKTKKHSSKW